MSEQHAQGADAVVDLNNELKTRREKLANLREQGIAFPNDFRRDHTSDQLHAEFDGKENEELEALNIEVAVAGRMMTRRIMGKASFVTLQDVGGRIQLYVARDDLPEGVYNEQFKKWDLGDILGAKGKLFKTKTGELSIHCTELRLLTKALRPLPDKFHGLQAIAILIIVRCLMSLFREKTGKESWGWRTLADGTKLDLCHWENAIGRGAWVDVSLDFPTVSRSHAALLRDDKGNWKLQPLQTKNGTRLNGKKVTHTTPLKTGDIIDLGGVGMEFYAISEAEEREQAMRWGVAERPLSPGRTLGYLTVFQIMMAVQCIPGREVQQVVMIAGAFAILMAAMWVTYLIYRSMKRTAFEVETIAFFLCTLSFAVAAAYDPSNLLTQPICVIAGIVVFLVLSVLLRDLKSTVSLRWPVAIFTCLLLIFNVLFGSQLFGARNWIHIGPIGFQPHKSPQAKD